MLKAVIRESNKIVSYVANVKHLHIDFLSVKSNTIHEGIRTDSHNRNLPPCSPSELAAREGRVLYTYHTPTVKPGVKYNQNEA